MRRWSIALLVSLLALPCSQAREAAQVIDDCLTRLDPAADVGYAHIVAQCPELPAALERSPLSASLPEDWSRPDNLLSAAGLNELRGFLTQTRARAQRPAPSVDALDAVLASVAPLERAHGNWWERLKRWLRQVLAPRANPQENWLRRWLGGLQVSRNVTSALVWAGLALVVALALGILLNELRLARTSGRLARAPGAARGAGPAGAESPDPNQIARAAPAEQPRLLLEFITRRLAAQQRLPPARAFTTRELTQRAQLPDEERANLAALAAVCEQVRFSGCEVAGASLAHAIARGQHLLAALDTRAAEPQAA